MTHIYILEAMAEYCISYRQRDNGPYARPHPPWLLGGRKTNVPRVASHREGWHYEIGMGRVCLGNSIGSGAATCTRHYHTEGVT